MLSFLGKFAAFIAIQGELKTTATTHMDLTSISQYDGRGVESIRNGAKTPSTDKSMAIAAELNDYGLIGGIGNHVTRL